jgi:hypothetical protein
MGKAHTRRRSAQAGRRRLLQFDAMLSKLLEDRSNGRRRYPGPIRVPTERDQKTGRFLQGTSGLPGRPKGSRNKLAEPMIDDLYRDWKAHGIQAIRETRETRPADYLRIVAMIISKCDVNLADDMHDAALRANYRGAAAAGSCDDCEDAGPPMIARTIRLLLASGFLAAVAHVAPVAELAALATGRRLAGNADLMT